MVSQVYCYPNLATYAVEPGSASPSNTAARFVCAVRFHSSRVIAAGTAAARRASSAIERGWSACRLYGTSPITASGTSPYRRGAAPNTACIPVGHSIPNSHTMLNAQYGGKTATPSAAFVEADGSAVACEHRGNQVGIVRPTRLCARTITCKVGPDIEMPAPVNTLVAIPRDFSDARIPGSPANATPYEQAIPDIYFP